MLQSQIGTYSSPTRLWQLDLDAQGGAAERTLTTDDPSTWPVTGDWDGDGDDDVGVWNPADGSWHLDTDGLGGAAELQVTMTPPNFSGSWSQYQPVVGDWDGDDNLGLYRAASGTWYLSFTLGSTTDRTLSTPNGAPIVPVVGDWDGDGDDNIGVYRRDTAVWSLDTDGQGGVAEQTRTLTVPGATPEYRPVVGDWDGDGDSNIGLYQITTGT